MRAMMTDALLSSAQHIRGIFSKGFEALRRQVGKQLCNGQLGILVSRDDYTGSGGTHTHTHMRQAQHREDNLHSCRRRPLAPWHLDCLWAERTGLLRAPLFLCGGGGGMWDGR